jgi:membrane protease YdiL (CAAX protease family)
LFTGAPQNHPAEGLAGSERRDVHFAAAGEASRDQQWSCSRYITETFPLLNRDGSLAWVALKLLVPTDGSGDTSTVGSGAHASGRLRSDGTREVLLPLGLVIVVSLAPFVGYNPAHAGGRAVLVGLAALTLLAALTRRARSFRLGLALTSTIAAFALPWEVSWWPLPGAVGMLVYVLSCLVGRNPSDPVIHLRLGRLTRTDVLGILGLALVSAIFLLAFRALMPPHEFLGDQLITEIPAWLLALAGVLFATANAAVEEMLFRGAILHHLGHAFGVWPAVALQAVAFGLLHLHGYPYGPIGVALATVYGLLLGAVRLRSHGLLAPWLAHVVADSVIFVFILQAATRTS